MNRYAELESALRPLLKERTPAVLAEGLARLGKTAEALEAADLERILKRVVFPELQKTLPPAEARRRVEALLAELAAPAPGLSLEALEAELRRFGLYFDWPEVQRLRRLVGGLRAEWNPEQAREAQLVVEALKEKLESRLVQQAREIAELKRHYERVKKVGGRKARRLASLLAQIEAAQAEGLLAAAEVDQARALAAELLKLVESSVVEPVTEEDLVVLIEEDEPLEIEVDLEALSPEQQDKIREIERSEEERRLEALLERYRPVLDEGLRRRAQALMAKLGRGELLGEALEAFHKDLEAAFQDRLAEARARYEWIAEKLRTAEQMGAPSASLWAQLGAVAEALTQGLYPEGIEELEREAERLLAQAKAEAQAKDRARARAEEARRFAEAARERIDPARQPELAEALLRLLAQAEEGSVDPGLFAELKEALPKALAADEAQQLWARLQAVPELGALAGERAAVEAALEEGALKAAKAHLEALEAKARAELAAELERLRLRARHFGLELEALASAEAELQAGRFPDLSGLRVRLEEAIADGRQRARARLARLRSLAERYLGLGGEAFLERLAEAEAGLDQGLPDFERLEEELAALEGRREALRKSLADRFSRLSQGFARYKHLTGETRSRLGALMAFLDEGFSRLDRLGTEGLLELERALAEAEPLLDQLAEEYRAAKALAAELEGQDLEALLGVFDAPEAPAAAVDYRVRGILAAARVTPGGVEGELPVDPERLSDLAHELRAGGEPRSCVLYFPGHVLVYAFLPGGERVVLAEKPLLNRVLGLVEQERGAQADAG